MTRGYLEKVSQPNATGTAQSLEGTQPPRHARNAAAPGKLETMAAASHVMRPASAFSRTSGRSAICGAFSHASTSAINAPPGRSRSTRRTGVGCVRWRRAPG